MTAATVKKARASIPTVAERCGRQPAEVRAWANANGHAVGSRGRLSAEVVDAFVAAQR